MKRFCIAACLSLACILCFPGNLLAADENSESVVRTGKKAGEWSFGLQAAPLTFGLSLIYAITPDWSVQGVVTPEGGDAGVLFRVLRRTSQARYWSSYLFAGYADGESEVFFSDDDEGIAATAGLGVEWSWQAKNPNHPPLSWSFEFGLGYRDQDTDDDDFFFDDEEDGLFLALGWGIHYTFK